MTAPTQQGKTPPPGANFVAGIGKPRPELGAFDQFPAEAVDALYTTYKQQLNLSMTMYLRQHAAQQGDLDFGKLSDYTRNLTDFIWGTPDHVGAWGFLNQRFGPDQLKDFAISRRVAACEKMFIDGYAIKKQGDDYWLFDSKLMRVGSVPTRASASLVTSEHYFDTLQTYATRVKQQDPDKMSLLAAFIPCPEEIETHVNPTKVFGAQTLDEFLQSEPLPGELLRQDPPRASFASTSAREMYLIDAPQLAQIPARAYVQYLQTNVMHGMLAELYRSEGFSFLQPDLRRTVVDHNGRPVLSYLTVRNRYEVLARTSLPLSHAAFTQVIRKRLTTESSAKMIQEVLFVHAALTFVFGYAPELHRVATVNPDTGMFAVGTLPLSPALGDLTGTEAASAYVDLSTVERTAHDLARACSQSLDHGQDITFPFDSNLQEIYGLSSLRFTPHLKDAMDAPDLSVYNGFFRAMPRSWSDVRSLQSPYYGEFADLLQQNGLPRASMLFVQLCNRHALMSLCAGLLRGR